MITPEFLWVMNLTVASLMIRVLESYKPDVCQACGSPLARTGDDLPANSSVHCRRSMIRYKLTSLAVVRLRVLMGSGNVALFPYFWGFSIVEVILGS